MFQFARQQALKCRSVQAVPLHLLVLWLTEVIPVRNLFLDVRMPI